MAFALISNPDAILSKIDSRRSIIWQNKNIKSWEQKQQFSSH